MNRKFRGISWAGTAEASVLVYRQYRAIVQHSNQLKITWQIYDTAPRFFIEGESIAASGIATSTARACFMVETWIEGATRGKP